MSDNGTGMDTPPAAGSASGAVTSREATRKNPNQRYNQGIKIDRNKHGIRREVSLNPKPAKRNGRKKV